MQQIKKILFILTLLISSLVSQVLAEGVSCYKSDVVTDNEDPELNQFYYHSDHLGSSSYITNLSGNIVQHIEYVPFGEVFLEERNNKWNTPYLFNGKELDEETGLYYYGARYYNSRSSLWLSVDPLAEKYPGVSPYCYTMNNPVKFIDPDGREIVVPDAVSRASVLEYMSDQFGANHGYSFNDDNKLVYNKHDSHKNYNKYQKSLNKNLQKIIEHKKNINVEISDTKSEFSIPIKRGTDLILDADGKIVMGKNGLPKLGGELRIVADQLVDVSTTGGALFYTNESDESNTAYLKMNGIQSEAARFKTKKDKVMTGGSKSSVFMHEILDHGLDYIKNGNTEYSHGKSVRNVKFHNKALENKGLPKRISHHE